MSESIKLLVWKKYADMVAEAANIAGVKVDIHVMEEYSYDEIVDALGGGVDAVLIDDWDLKHIVHHNEEKIFSVSGYISPEDGTCFYDEEYEGVFGGTRYSIPCFSEVMVLYIRNGLTEFEVGTWNDFYDSCVESGANNGNYCVLWPSSNLAEVFSFGGGNIDLLRELIDADLVQQFSVDENDVLNCIMSGQTDTVFVIGGLEILKQIQENGYESEWKIAALPESETFPTQVKLNSFSWIVCSNEDEERAAETAEGLVEIFCHNEEVKEYMVENFYVIPDAIWGDGEVETSFGEALQGIIGIREGVAPLIRSEYYTHNNSAMVETIMKRMFSGDLSVAQAFTMLADYLGDIVEPLKTELDHITIYATAEQKKLLVGENLNAGGMYMTAYYMDGSSREIPYSQWEIVGGLPKQSGENISVTVAYTEDGITKETEVVVDVYDRNLTGLEITSQPVKKEYLEGELFEPIGMSVKAYYDNNIERRVPLENLMEIRIRNAGSQASHSITEALETDDGYVVVSYQEIVDGKETTLEAETAILVFARDLIKIDVIVPPDKTRYVEGERIDPTGMVVYATYASGLTREISLGSIRYDNNGYLEAKREYDESTGEKKSYMSISYTENGKTQTTGIGGLTVLKKKEANAEVNQSRLSYECGIGQASVNVATGKADFAMPVVSIGANDYGIEVVQVFRGSELNLPNTIKTYMAEGWKLNVQQYLYAKLDEYCYVDGQGVTHALEKLGDGRYYDPSGNGLVLTVGETENILFDQYGNKMYFTDGVLTKEESCHNPSARKLYNYQNGKLISVYDDRMKNNKIEFIYNTNNLLSEIRCKQVGATSRKVYRYYYDAAGLLVRVEKNAGNNTKDVALFGYIRNSEFDNRLVYAIDAEDKSAVRFWYDEEEGEKPVLKVSTGFILRDFTAGTEISSFEEKSSNTFVYEKSTKNIFRTSVTNEKGLEVAYYLNEKGITTSILEANNGDMNDLRSLEKRAGVTVKLSEHGGAEKINGCGAVALTNGQGWAKEFSGDDEINKYRKNKYHVCHYFSVSFWLKFEEKSLSETKLQFTVNENAGTSKIISFDDTAKNAWQLITVPVEIQEETIWKLELTPTGVNGCKIADMKLLVDQSIRFRIRSDDDSAALEEFTSVKFLRPGAARSTEKLLSEGYYMSEKDLQATYYSMATSQTDTFILSLCDNTERHAVKNARLYHAGKDKEFALDLPSNGKARFYQEILSSDGGTKITGDVYFGHDETGKVYDGICQETRASRDEKSSASYVYLDYKGLLKEERDEYGVKTEYQYDCFGRPKIKTISAGTEETLVFNVERTATTVKDTGLTSQCLTTFDELFGNTEKTEYQGKDETDNALTTTYGYDDFNERLISVKNDADENPGENTLTYNEKGKLQKVTAADYDEESNAYNYGYAFEYDQFGNVSKSSLAKETGEEQVLSERVTDYALGKTTEKKYRETGNADETVITLDKYGRTDEIREKDFAGSEKTTTFTRQNLSESAGAAEVTEMYDPYENRTYVYSYDDANNCTGYTIKDGNNAGEEFFSIKKTGENKVSYKLNDIYSDCVSEVVYDDNVLMSPRVIETSSILVNNSDVNDGEVKYIYDAFGRISQKEHSIYDKLSDVSTIKVISEYKTGTMLKKTFKTELEDGGDIVNAFDYSYEYTDRGLVSESTCHRKYYLQNPNAVDLEEMETRSYMYDKADRLKSEIRPINGVDIKTTYTYRPDGNLGTESREDGFEREYVYADGRLKAYHNGNEGNEVTFTYDNFGNCTGYSGVVPTVMMAWKRGNLLAKYKRFEADIVIKAKYGYNSRGQRYKKRVNGVETTYYYDGEKLIAEKTGDRVIRYMYDAEGLLGMAVWYNTVEKSKDNMVYHFVKDGQGNVIGLMNYYDAEAWYSYDAWGNCKVLNPDGTVNTKAEFIGNINPIRWKSQYYDAESRMYYIGGRYYDPDIKRYVSPGEPEEAMANAGTVYGINPYLLCLTNPVNMVYNGYTIETDGELSYEPDELSEWKYFWKVTWNKFWNSKFGKGLAIGLFVAATVLAIVYPPFAAIYGQALLGVGLSLGVGGLVAGLRSRSQGNSFWDGFVNHISENWSQELAIGMAVALVTFGVSRAVQAMKQVGPHCFIAGTLVACLSADGEEIHKPIEEIEVGDRVLAYDEETGEQAYKPVVRLFRNQTKEWYHVFIGGEEIGCTGEHPFYVEGKGFIPAKELRRGDKCLLSTGKDVTIEKVEVEKLTEAETTYNFEVADFHTYYVTEKDVLVHNTCGEILDKVPDGYKPTYKNGVYDPNPKHGMVQHGRSSPGLSPEYGQYALDNAIPYPKGGKALYAYNGKDIIQLMPNHDNTIWHGFFTSINGVNGDSARNWLRHYFNLK